VPDTSHVCSTFTLRYRPSNRSSSNFRRCDFPDYNAAVLLQFSAVPGAVALQPRDLSPIQKQREDFIAMWSAPEAGSIDGLTRPTEN
jgi:hypothetical protein